MDELQGKFDEISVFKKLMFSGVQALYHMFSRSDRSWLSFGV